MSDVFENVMELAKRRGFIWPTSECYGAVAGFIDYGPLGAMMKRRIENIWREFYVIREGYYEIECPTIAQEAVFIASGHVAGFADKMCQCPHCKEYLRADHVAEGGGIKNASTMKNEELAAALAGCKCLACEEVLGKVEVFGFNLMFKTIDRPRFPADRLPPPRDSTGDVRGLCPPAPVLPRQAPVRRRPDRQILPERDLAPAGHDPAPRVHAGRGRDLRPPGREEPAPAIQPLRGLYGCRSSPAVQQQKCEEAVTLSMREAVDKGVIANEYLAYYVALTHELLVTIGIKPERLRFRQHLPDERAHYATDCWDAEIFSDRFGWVETVGLADRTDYDLNAHAKESGTPMTVFIQYR